MTSKFKCVLFYLPLSEKKKLWIKNKEYIWGGPDEIKTVLVSGHRHLGTKEERNPY